TGDGGEVVAEEHAAVGGDEVLAVIDVFGRGGAVVLRLDHLVLDESGVEGEGDDIGAHGGEHEPHGVEGFTTGEGDRTPADRGQDTEYQQTHPGGGRHLCGFHTHREVGGITVDQVVICPGI